MNSLRTYLPAIIVVLMLTMSSCELIGDIFQAGMWFMLIIVVLIVLVVAWIFRKLRR